MTFAEALAAVPFTSRGADATGFLPPIARAQGHMGLVLAVVSDEDDVSMTDEQLVDELTQARDHWLAIIIPPGVVSASADQAIGNLSELLTAATVEWSNWERADRIKNIRDVANRVVGFTAALDRELVGLTDSDAGSQL